MGVATALALFGAACFAALLITPVVVNASFRWGVVDHPDGNRKGQLRPVPLGGGVAVALAAMGVLASFWGLGLFEQPAADREAVSLITAFLPAVIVLGVVGLVDDVIGLTGIYKLIGQVLAASLLVAGGNQFHTLGLFGMEVDLGGLSVPFTIFFVLGAINAFNLIDGSDALASSVGAVICGTLGIIAGSQGDAACWALCMASAGALTGFLAFNAPPARIFLGDVGSMLIGLIVAGVAVRCSIKQQAAFALVVPVAVCAIPILDAAAALVRRVTTGQSVFTPDRGHLHHALLHRGWTPGQTALFVAGLTAVTCGGAVASYFTRNDGFAVAATAGVFAVLAATRTFGHSEIRLLASHARGILRRLIRGCGASGSGAGIERAFAIQGQRHWETIWAGLREAAPELGVANLRLNVNIPRLHESFYATWQCDDGDAVEEGWRLTLPLTIDGREIGKLALSGTSRGAAALPEMQSVLEFLEPLEDQLRMLAEGAESVDDRCRDAERADSSALPRVVPAAVTDGGVLVSLRA